MILEALLLGLSTGIYCFAQCGLVILPYIFSTESSGIKSSLTLLFKYLTGRFWAYVITGAASGAFGLVLQGQVSIEEHRWINIALGISFLALACLMILHTLSFAQNNHSLCRIAKRTAKYSQFPFLLGFFTGINLCPPFLLAIGKVFEQAKIFEGILFFTLFFLATSLFLIPLIFSIKLNKKEAVQSVARLASFLSGIFLFFQGLFTLI